MPSDPDNRRSAYGLFNMYLRPYWASIMLMVVFSMGVGVAMSLRPLVIAPALDVFMESKAAPAQDVGGISLNNLGPTLARYFEVNQGDIIQVGIFVALLYVFVSLAIASLGAVSQVLLIRTRVSVIRDLMLSLHQHLLTLPLEYFFKRKVGDLGSRLNHDVNMTALSLDSIARGMLQSAAQIAITMTILFRTDATFCAIVVALGAVHMVITKALGKKIHRRAKDVAEKQGIAWAGVMESLGGVRMIKSFSAERFEHKRMNAIVNNLRRSTINFRLIKYVEIPVRLTVDGIIVGAVLVLMFYAIKNGSMTPQAAALFFFLSQQLITPISEFFRQVLGLHSLLGAAERIMEIFNTHSHIKDGELESSELEECIAIKNVGFEYEPGVSVLEDISLTINRGEVVAIVGPSGAGKSTLVDIILRLYDVTKGSVVYDGNDIRKYKQRGYRRHYGVVAQESLLFNDTIRHNVIYNRPEDKERLEHALWAANAEEFVSEFPEGLDTIVGDRGVRLSGGQRQRLAIARAIYGGPSILVFDEATSALDSEAERQIHEALDRITREMTVIIIAHRLSTITHADKIAVLNKGRLEIAGPHSEIIAKSPTYKRLYELQFSTSTG